MASRMIINMDSVNGYNKELKQAVVGMKVGVNNSANSDIKSRSCADGWSYVEDQKTDLASLESEHNERRKARLKKKSGARLKMRSVFDTQATLDGI